MFNQTIPASRIEYSNSNRTLELVERGEADGEAERTFRLSIVAANNSLASQKKFRDYYLQ
jgi:hypothetical protein